MGDARDTRRAFPSSIGPNVRGGVLAEGVAWARGHELWGKDVEVVADCRESSRRARLNVGGRDSAPPRPILAIFAEVHRKVIGHGRRLMSDGLSPGCEIDASVED